MNQASTKKTAEASFEDRITELETVVAQLEGGNLPLEQSLQLAQRGQELAAQCEALLKNAELKLEELANSSTPETSVQKNLLSDLTDE